MKTKKVLSTALFALAGVLAVLFTVFLIRDYRTAYEFGSSPFYLYVAVRAAEFLIPAAVGVVAGIMIRKK